MIKMNVNRDIEIVDWFLKIFAFVLLIIMIMLVLEAITQEDYGLKEVKCYDNKNNEVLNMSCLKEVKCGAVKKLFDRCEIKNGGDFD